MAEPKVVIGRNVRVERERRRWTQEDLAHHSGMHPVEVGRVERGLRDVRVSTVARLARGLGVSAATLMRNVK